MVTKSTTKKVGSTTIRQQKTAPSADKPVLVSVKTKHAAWGQKTSSARSADFRPNTYFEAATYSPRIIQTPDYGPNSYNAEIAKIRAKSRWMYANDPQYRQACRQVGNNVVHYGIKPNIKDKVLRKLWNKWVRESDARGQLDFYGQQHFAAVATARDGEQFFRIRQRRPGDMKSGILFQLEALEPDHVPLNKNELAGNNIIISGVERSPIQRTVAYWMHDYHPNESFLRGSGIPQRVPAESVIHLYMPDRATDTRGYPWGASALTTAERYRTYDDTELERKIMASSRGGYYKKPRLAGDEETFFGDEEVIFRPQEPNEWIEVPAGWDIEQATPAPSDTNYAVYRRENISSLAVAFGWAVELVSMNWEKLASDRQYRALMLEIVRHIESIQCHMMNFKLNQTVWELFVSDAFENKLWSPAKGKTLEDYFDIAWIVPKRGYIHPVQDIQAVAMAIEKGLESRKRAVSATGEDVEDIDDDNVEDTTRAASLGLRYSMFGLDGSTSPSATVDGGEDGDEADADINVADLMNSYGVAVRAGAITPQLEDEIAFRKMAGLPPMSEAAKELWATQNHTRQPITLAQPGGSSPFGGAPVETGDPVEA